MANKEQKQDKSVPDATDTGRIPFDRQRLIRELKACMPGIQDGNPLLSGADAFHFLGNRLCSYNDSISASVETDLVRIVTGSDGESEERQGIECSIRAKELFTLLQKLPPEQEPSVELVDGKLRITTTNITADLPLLDPKLADKIRNLEIKIEGKWRRLPSDFQEALKACDISHNDSYIYGIFVTGGAMYSADHTKINRYRFNKSLSSSSVFWIADEAARLLARLPHLVAYQITGNWAHFRTKPPAEDDQSIPVVFSARRLNNNEYPLEKIEQVLETHSASKEDVIYELPPAIKQAIDRAAIFAADISNYKTIYLDLSSSGITVVGEIAGARFSECVPWDSPIPIEERIGVDGGMINYALARSLTFSIKRQTAEGREVKRLVFERDNFIHVTSTIELNQNDAPKKKGKGKKKT